MVSVFFTIFYAFMVWQNPDDDKMPNHNAKYDCWAVSWGEKPVMPNKDNDPFSRTMANGEVQSMVAVNVAEQFRCFFWIMFIIACVHLAATITTCAGNKTQCCAWIGSCLNCLTSCATFILVIIGGFWRWSHTGRVCAATFADLTECPEGAKDCNRAYDNEYMNAKNAKWQYWNVSGSFMTFILIFTYFIICCMCCCSCMGATGKPQ